MRKTARYAQRLLIGVLALLAFFPGGGIAATADLASRLASGETVTFVTLGDSLAAGYELQAPERDSYPEVFRALLQRRYPAARIRMIRAGIPGDTAAGGRGRVARDVLAHHPDAVIVQFGGNDTGQWRAPEAFKEDLKAIIAQIRGSGTSVLLLATPPIVSPTPDAPMVRAVKEIAAAECLPVADFDGALRQDGIGPLGPFPFSRHPGAYQHAVMARALYRAFATLLPGENRLQLAACKGTQILSRDAPAILSVQVHSASDTPVCVYLEQNGQRRECVVQPNKDGNATARFSIALGKDTGRTQQQRALVWARQRDSFACDLCWLARTPLLALNSRGELGRAALAFSTAGWGGMADLSGGFRVTRSGDSLLVRVQVRDDRPAYSRDANALHNGDCLELYLDLRPPGAQAHPFWEEGVAMLLLRPDTGQWRALTRLPAGWQPQIVESKCYPGGYRLTVRLPLGSARSVESIGFDLALDDADDDRGRLRQMLWAGGADDYLDASLYGALALTPLADKKPRVRVVIY